MQGLESDQMIGSAPPEALASARKIPDIVVGIGLMFKKVIETPEGKPLNAWERLKFLIETLHDPERRQYWENAGRSFRFGRGLIGEGPEDRERRIQKGVINDLLDPDYIREGLKGGKKLYFKAGF